MLTDVLTRQRVLEQWSINCEIIRTMSRHHSTQGSLGKVALLQLIHYAGAYKYRGRKCHPCVVSYHRVIGH
jgi:hypothetical protein